MDENDGTPVGIDKVLTNQLIIDGFVHRVASASDETQLALEWWSRDGGNVAMTVRCRGDLRDFARDRTHSNEELLRKADQLMLEMEMRRMRRGR